MTVLVLTSKRNHVWVVVPESVMKRREADLCLCMDLTKLRYFAMCFFAG